MRLLTNQQGFGLIDLALFSPLFILLLVAGTEASFVYLEKAKLEEILRNTIASYKFSSEPLYYFDGDYKLNKERASRLRDSIYRDLSVQLKKSQINIYFHELEIDKESAASSEHARYLGEIYEGGVLKDSYFLKAPIFELDIRGRYSGLSPESLKSVLGFNYSYHKNLRFQLRGKLF